MRKLVVPLAFLFLVQFCVAAEAGPIRGVAARAKGVAAKAVKVVKLPLRLFGRRCK